MAFRFAFITDTHLYPDAPQNFGGDGSQQQESSIEIYTELIRQLNEFQPEFVIHGGDIVCGGAIDIGYQIVTNSCEYPGPTYLYVACPAGKQVLGGGCYASDAQEEIESSNPTGTTGWECRFDVGCSTNLRTATVFAICANVK